MEVTVLFFGSLTEITGTSRMRIPEVTDTDQLDQVLKDRFPALEQLTYRMAVNRKVIGETTLLTAETEIALLPPFSGG